jgi:hypothetical protein
MQFIISDTNQPTITNMSESEARRGVEDAGDKIKAGAKAIGKKVEDPNRDLETEYEKEKFKEKTRLDSQ